MCTKTNKVTFVNLLIMVGCLIEVTANTVLTVNYETLLLLKKLYSCHKKIRWLNRHINIDLFFHL